MEFEPVDQFRQRQKKLQEIEDLGHPAYPHKFAWTHNASQILKEYGNSTAEDLSAKKVELRTAGRIVALRPHGKAAFGHLLSDGARLQFYVKLDVVGEKAFKLFQLLDLGDIIGVSGHLFRTKTNELTIWVERLEILNKACCPCRKNGMGWPTSSSATGVAILT